MRVAVVAITTTCALVLSLMATAPPASGAVGEWYRIPGFAGTIAVARLDSLHTQTAGSGTGSGRISINKKFGKGKTYVQYKPSPRGPGGWNRGTPNHTRRSGARRYFWSDNYFWHTTGYQFRICKVRIGPDPCGNILVIEAGAQPGGG